MIPSGLQRRRHQYRAHGAHHTRRSALQGLLRALEAIEPETMNHSSRVRRFSLLLAETLGLDDRQLRQLSVAANFHDIGKIQVPSTILNKPEKLTDDEFRLVKEHPEHGVRILTPLIDDPAILNAVRTHHERVDGTCYPNGLKGYQIPLFARVIAIADSFDAMTSWRPYREAMNQPEALDEIRREAGTQFDPLLVEAFLEAVARNNAQETLALR